MLRLVFLLLPLVLLGCTYANQPPFKEADDQLVMKPDEGKAQIWFMRYHSEFAGHYNASTLFHLQGDDEVLIGSMPNVSKMVVDVDPGKHSFMVLSTDAADFLEAEVLANHRYYVMVVPHPGPLYYRFSLAAVRKEGDGPFVMTSPLFQEWTRKTKLVEPSKKTEAWLNSFGAQKANAERNLYWEKWQTKGLDSRSAQTIYVEDGVPLN